MINSARGPGFPVHPNPDAPGPTLMFSRGGIQGGEGVTGGEAWYIENVEEELDMGREWFFDESEATLVYMPNATKQANAVDQRGAPTG